MRAEEWAREVAKSPYPLVVSFEETNWVRTQLGPVYIQQFEDLNDLLVLVATNGTVFHVPVLHQFTPEYLEGLHYGKTVQKAPLLIGAGMGDHVRPECGLNFWSPFWNAVTVPLLKSLAGLSNDGYRMCRACGWRVLGSEAYDYVLTELVNQRGSHFGEFSWGQKRAITQP